jgi:2,3-bisphosphoglycerate-independent phosphoglycerate mutase
MTGPLALIILDGWGIRAERDQNAVALAEPATFLDLLKRYPSGTLEASGEAVGLPAGQMGNSEVGHTNLGAGRVVYQDLTRIDKSIREHDLETRPALLAAYDRCAGASTHALHLIGLLSDGGVHSHQQHLHALIALAKARGVSRVFVHVLTDGRDTSPTGGRAYVAALEAAIAAAGVGRIASVSGRYWAMDRDKRWERTKLAYDAIVHGEGPSAASAGAVIEAAYADKVTDEFIKPHAVVGADGKPVGPIRDGDTVVLFNFRADRMRQIVRALAFEEPATGSWYNSDLSPSQFDEMMRFEKNTGSKDMLWVYGVGNHGGGPTIENLASIRRMDADPALVSGVAICSMRSRTRT